MANLTESIQDNLKNALTNKNGRSAELIAHDDILRQTVVALRANTRLGEHNSPPAATLQVLIGSVLIEVADTVQGEFHQGELWVLSHERHSVLALEDCVFLLTTVTSTRNHSHS